MDAIREHLARQVVELEERLQGAMKAVDASAQLVADLKKENDRLRLEAEGWAQEARTHRATVHEIYRIVSGGKGEPGDWHGAEPVRREFDRMREGIKKARLYAGDNLPAGTGLSIIEMLEKSLKGGA